MAGARGSQTQCAWLAAEVLGQSAQHVRGRGGDKVRLPRWVDRGVCALRHSPRAPGARGAWIPVRTRTSKAIGCTRVWKQSTRSTENDMPLSINEGFADTSPRRNYSLTTTAESVWCNTAGSSVSCLVGLYEEGHLAWSQEASHRCVCPALTRGPHALASSGGCRSYGHASKFVNSDEIIEYIRSRRQVAYCKMAF